MSNKIDLASLRAHLCATKKEALELCLPTINGSLH